MSRTTAWAVAIALASAVPITLAACDPVHTNAQDDLGGEAPGVRTGPLHRAGQPCLLCHDGKLGDPVEFAVAGTVFHDAESRQGLSGATVTLRDSTGAVFTARTNEAGNFYVQAGEFTPAYPVRSTLAYSGKSVEMKSLIGRDGSCGGCHIDPGSPSSPGHIYFYEADGGTP